MHLLNKFKFHHILTLLWYIVNKRNFGGWINLTLMLLTMLLNKSVWEIEMDSQNINLKNNLNESIRWLSTKNLLFLKIFNTLIKKVKILKNHLFELLFTNNFYYLWIYLGASWVNSFIFVFKRAKLFFILAYSYSVVICLLSRKVEVENLVELIKLSYFDWVEE